jgi:phosphoribosylanthranilate isomerase
MKLKVCGMTSFEQLQKLDQLGVDFAGLIFYKNSKRFVGNKLSDQKSEIRNLKIKKIGVFVNAEIDTLKKEVNEYGLTYVQLHGDESAEFCRRVKDFVHVIKVIRINDQSDLEKELTVFEEACDYLLFDTDSKQYGGTGKQFNWNRLIQSDVKKPFFLSGGIGLEDVDKVKSFHHGMLYAIDVNSRFETSPGIKNLEQVEVFLEGIKLTKEDT